MKPHIAQNVPREVWDLFETVKSIINSLPTTIEVDAYLFGIKLPRDVAVSTAIPNCHHVTRALARHLPVTVHDGGVLHINKSGTPVQLHHSWLTLQGFDESWIIDPWPLGVVSGPALFIQGYAFDFQEADMPETTLPEQFANVVEVLAEHIHHVLNPS